MIELNGAWWNGPRVGGHRIRHATVHRRFAPTGSQAAIGPAAAAAAQPRGPVGAGYRPWARSRDACVNPAPPAVPQSVAPCPGMETGRGRAPLPLSAAVPAGPVRAFSQSQVVQ